MQKQFLFQPTTTFILFTALLPVFVAKLVFQSLVLIVFSHIAGGTLHPGAHVFTI